MIKKLEKCCDMGTYECQIPMPIKARVRHVDFCIADIVAALNAANITTDASCCGHGKVIPDIILEDGRILLVLQMEEGKKIYETINEYAEKHLQDKGKS